MQTLLTFGDSWPQGGELKADNGDRPYGDQLAEKHNYNHVNYGSPGASNEDMVLQLQDYINKKIKDTGPITAIFFLTNPARSMHWPSGMSWQHDTEERSHWPSDAKDFVKELTLHFHDADRDSIRTSMAVATLQKMCEELGYQDYYFPGWIRQTEWLAGVDIDKIYKAGNETAADWFGATKHNGEHLLNVADNEYIRPNFCHPNHKGHTLIAEKLAEWIKL